MFMKAARVADELKNAEVTGNDDKLSDDAKKAK